LAAGEAAEGGGVPAAAVAVALGGAGAAEGQQPAEAVEGVEEDGQPEAVAPHEVAREVQGQGAGWGGRRPAKRTNANANANANVKKEK